MTRNDLLIKRKELAESIDSLRGKMRSIDEVLAMFPEETPSLPGTGKYLGMAIVDAIRDTLAVPGIFYTVSEIAALLKKEGIQSESENFTTVINSTCARLLAKGELAQSEKGDRKTYGKPPEPTIF